MVYGEPYGIWYMVYGIWYMVYGSTKAGGISVCLVVVCNCYCLSAAVAAEADPEQEWGWAGGLRRSFEAGLLHGETDQISPHVSCGSGLTASIYADLSGIEGGVLYRSAGPVDDQVWAGGEHMAAAGLTIEMTIVMTIAVVTCTNDLRTALHPLVSSPLVCLGCAAPRRRRGDPRRRGRRERRRAARIGWRE